MENDKYVITQSDFELVQKDTKLADKPFETKPSTFLKDALKRFAKNKSSIVGAVILGIIILFAILVPIISNKNTSYVESKEKLLAPKLFSSKWDLGFWDGTVKYKGVVYDPINETPADFYKPAVSKLELLGEGTIDVVSKYGKGGCIVFKNDLYEEEAVLYSSPTTFTSTGNYKAIIKLLNEEGYNDNRLGEYSITLRYLENNNVKHLLLVDYSSNYEEIEVNISQALENAGIEKIEEASLCFNLKQYEDNDGGVLNRIYSYLLIESVIFDANEDVENYEELRSVISFTDANAMALKAKDPDTGYPEGYWYVKGVKNVHNVIVTMCNFTYDTYEEPYGEQEFSYPISDLDVLKRKGYCDYDKNDILGTFEILSKKCPVIEPISVECTDPVITTKVTHVKCIVHGYGLINHGKDEAVYTRAPRFLLGTDYNGFDLITKSFKGLRTSLLLGLGTAAFCFVFGLIWGSISGYFGGTIDLVMERFCDILSGVPWIVIMTLAILHLGNNLFTFFLALCMTGWMGTAGRTRTQFYRFKGREYVLASRTLGSSDFRLIFKHILPNSMGTIITSSVLMIPSVIFSESTLAFLNLGLQGVDAFGVMMSENQVYLQSYPHLVLFPAVIISLMMISFNLFGNGLRDAFNPSLKGSE